MRFRVEFTPAIHIGGSFTSEEYGSYDLAKTVLDAIANYTLLLHECSIMPDYSNMGFIEQEVDGEWVMFYNDILDN